MFRSLEHFAPTRCTLSLGEAGDTYVTSVEVSCASTASESHPSCAPSYASMHGPLCSLFLALFVLDRQWLMTVTRVRTEQLTIVFLFLSAALARVISAPLCVHTRRRTPRGLRWWPRPTQQVAHHERKVGKGKSLT